MVFVYNKTSFLLTSMVLDIKYQLNVVSANNRLFFKILIKNIGMIPTCNTLCKTSTKDDDVDQCRYLLFFWLLMKAPEF